MGNAGWVGTSSEQVKPAPSPSSVPWPSAVLAASPSPSRAARQVMARTLPGAGKGTRLLWEGWDW